MEQLIGMLNQEQDAGGDTDARRVVLEARVEELAAKVEALQHTLGQLNETLGEKLKNLINSVLLQSGFLEKFISATVERKIDERGDSTGSVDTDSIRKELETWMSSDHMKELFDEKFRAITLYIKTDVVPTAVRQALSTAEA